MRPTSICIKGQLNGPKVETMKLDGRLSAMERPYGNVRSYRSPGTLLSLKIFFFYDPLCGHGWSVTAENKR